MKQQKNLSCEVSRAPVKPMHKVTEDTEALKQLLTSVSSALQKNRVIANKLKADTTKVRTDSRFTKSQEYLNA